MARLHRRTWTRPDGTRAKAWQIVWTTAAGARRRRQFGTRREADRFLDQLRTARAQGLPGETGTIMLREAAEIWRRALDIGRDGEGPISAATRDQYDWAMDGYILPDLGDLELRALKRARLLAFRDDLLKSHLSRRSVRHVVKALKACLNEAQRRELIAVSTWGDVTVRLGAEARQIDIPSRRDVRAILETAERLRDSADARVAKAWRAYYTMVALAVATGMRQQEIRALDWTHIDFRRGLITVCQAADARGAIKQPKSAAGRRDIEMPRPLAAILKAWKLASAGKGLIFPAPRAGGLIERKNFYHRCWQDLQARAKLGRRYSFHTLRHFYASDLIAKGAGPKEVMRAMGHSSIEVTFDTYGHLFPEDRRDRRTRAAAVAAGLFGGGT